MDVMKQDFLLISFVPYNKDIKVVKCVGIPVK